MAEKAPMFRWKREQGEAMDLGYARVTPESRVLMLRWPNGGLVSNRPTALLVEREGETRRIPVPNVTWAVLWSLFGLQALMALLFMGSALKRK